MRRTIPFITLVVTTISLSLVSLLLMPFDRKGERTNRLGRFWARIHLKACGIRVSLKGLENVSEPPYVFMCNHQSVLDIFALLSALPLSFKWIAKKELFFVPFLGWALKAGRNISLDRKHPRKALRSMNEAACLIKEGVNVIIFPEGTWSTDGKLLPFKKGGFSLALKAGIPIIPVGIWGTGALQPQGHFLPLRKGSILIKIGEPICVQKHGERPSKTALAHAVRCRIEDLVSHAGESPGVSGK